MAIRIFNKVIKNAPGVTEELLETIQQFAAFEQDYLLLQEAALRTDTGLLAYDKAGKTFQFVPADIAQPVDISEITPIIIACGDRKLAQLFDTTLNIATQRFIQEEDTEMVELFTHDIEALRTIFIQDDTEKTEDDTINLRPFAAFRTFLVYLDRTRYGDEDDRVRATYPEIASILSRLYQHVLLRRAKTLVPAELCPEARHGNVNFIDLDAPQAFRPARVPYVISTETYE